MSYFKRVNANQNNIIELSCFQFMKKVSEALPVDCRRRAMGAEMTWDLLLSAQWASERAPRWNTKNVWERSTWKTGKLSVKNWRVRIRRWILVQHNINTHTWKELSINNDYEYIMQQIQALWVTVVRGMYEVMLVLCFWIFFFKFNLFLDN